MSLHRDDILSVCDSINVDLSETEISEVIETYELIKDTEAVTWDLIIENLIYECITNRTPYV
jgi:hypothetical protein